MIFVGPLSSLLILPRPSSLQQGLIVDSQTNFANKRSSFVIAPLSKYIAADSASTDLMTHSSSASYKGPIVALPSDCNNWDENTDLDQFAHSLKAMENQIKEFEVCTRTIYFLFLKYVGSARALL